MNTRSRAWLAKQTILQSLVASVFCNEAKCGSRHIGRQTERRSVRVLLARVPTNDHCPDASLQVAPKCCLSPRFRFAGYSLAGFRGLQLMRMASDLLPLATPPSDRRK